jgi:hypothetical protein
VLVFATMTAEQRRNFWAFFLLFLAGAAWAYMPEKPIWIDEFLHFVVGAEKTPQDAWHAFLRTGISNHGQTGLFFMFNFFSLKALDASFLALRLPSLVFTILLGLFFSLCLSLWRTSFFVGLMAVAAFFSHADLVPFISEARVYILLMAVSVGALAFFSVPLSERQNWRWQLFGGFVFLLGFLGHPYFVLYCGIAWFVGIAFLQINFRNLWAHCSPMVTIPSALLGLALASQTWFRFLGHKFGFSPFEHFKDGRPYPQVLVGWHIQAFGPLRYVVLILAITLCGTALVSAVKNKKNVSQTLAPLLLTVLAFVASFVVSWASIKSEYWIVSRQWVASSTLLILGVWGCFQTGLNSLISPILKKSIVALTLVMMLLSLHRGVGLHNDKKERAAMMLEAEKAREPLLLAKYGNPPAVCPNPDAQDELVALANWNCVRGGPVLPIFNRALCLDSGSL